MNNHALQLSKKRKRTIFSVIGYPIDTNVQITTDIGRFSIRESNNISQGIVVEIIDIELVEILVAAKDVGELAQRRIVVLNDPFYPGGDYRKIGLLDWIYISKIKINSRL